MDELYEEFKADLLEFISHLKPFYEKWKDFRDTGIFMQPKYAKELEQIFTDAGIDLETGQLI